MQLSRLARSLGAALSLAASAAGCSAQGSAENPVSRTVSWFDYVGAGDVRANCREGAPNHYRFVYNAIYTEQVRTYEVAANPVLSGATMEARALPKLNLTQVGLNSLDIFLHGAVSRQQIAQADLAELDRAVAADADAYGAPKDTFLRSDRFYWTVGACRSGRFYFTAFVDERPGFQDLHFPAILFRYDTTGVQVNLPRRLDNDIFSFQNYQLRKNADDAHVMQFLMQLGSNGLKEGSLF